MPVGNPNWKKGGPSPNPSGRPAVVEAFRLKARAAVDEHVLGAWIDEVQAKERIEMTDNGPVSVMQRGREWMRASELLAAYGYGKPAQIVALAGEAEGGRFRISLAIDDSDTAPTEETEDVGTDA